MLPRLNGQVVIVTGATRGIGRGIALQLSEAGAVVYITGRTLKRASGEFKGSLEETAEEISNKGGQCIPIQCDHSIDSDVDKLFDQVSREQDGRLDILVNNAYAGVNAIGDNMGKPFWEHDISTWDTINNVGLRNHYRCAVLASRMMVPKKHGLIVNISSVGGLRYLFNCAYGIGKAGVDRMAQDCGFELRKQKITMISLWPGAVQTEHMVNTRNKMAQSSKPEDQRMCEVIDKGETVEYTGRAIVYFAADANRLKKTGRVLLVSDLAEEYGFTDITGVRPPSMRSAKTLMSYNGNTWCAACTPSCLKIPKWVFYMAGYKF